MPTQKIKMNFYKNVIPYESQPEATERFNTRSPTAKYYRKSALCCDNGPFTMTVFKNVRTCCNSISKHGYLQANTAQQIDINGNLPDYHPDRRSYLQSRCLNFDKRSFNFNHNPDTNEADANCCSSNPSICNKVIYKPNNAQYSVQGAVSSGERLLRLKYNNITTTSKFNQYHRRYRGDTSENQYLKVVECKKCPNIIIP